jgi:hypothetical protein
MFRIGLVDDAGARGNFVVPLIPDQGDRNPGKDIEAKSGSGTRNPRRGKGLPESYKFLRAPAGCRQKPCGDTLPENAEVALTVVKIAERHLPEVGLEILRAQVMNGQNRLDRTRRTGAINPNLMLIQVDTQLSFQRRDPDNAVRHAGPERLEPLSGGVLGA